MYYIKLFIFALISIHYNIGLLISQNVLESVYKPYKEIKCIIPNKSIDVKVKNYAVLGPDENIPVCSLYKVKEDTIQYIDSSNNVIEFRNYKFNSFYSLKKKYWHDHLYLFQNKRIERELNPQNLPPPKKKYFYSPNGNYFTKKRWGKYGFLDSLTQKLTRIQFNDIYHLKEGRIAVKRKHRIGFIDMKGNKIIDNIYDDASVCKH